MNKKLILLILLCLAAMVLSNVLDIVLIPEFSKPAAGDSPAYLRAIITSLTFSLTVWVLPWMALLPLILHLLHRFPWRESKRITFILRHLAVCLLFSLGQIVVHMMFEPDRGAFFGNALYRLVMGIFSYFGNNVFFYVCVVVAYLALTFFRQLRQTEVREARLAETLADARLSSLKMKLQPHFIFNALQSINVLMLDDQVEPASEMLTRLSHLLRHSIDMDDTQLVTVESELDTVRNYLAIEEIRFTDRLEIERSIDPKVGRAMLPGLILQPLIENAVKHGIAKTTAPVRIGIHIQRVDTRLTIKIVNDGPNLPLDWSFERHAGFGLRTTRRRLELIYGRDFTFEIRNAGENRVSAAIAVPFSEEIMSIKREIRS